MGNFYRHLAIFLVTLDTSNSTFVAIIFNKKEEEDGSEDHLTTFGQFGVFNYTTDFINTLAEEKDSSFQRNNNNDCRYLQPFKMLSLIETQRSVACTFLFFTFQPIYMLAKRKIGRKYFIQIIFPSRNWSIYISHLNLILALSINLITVNWLHFCNPFGTF